MLEPHLGGHANRSHVDAGALRWLVRDFGVRSMLDVGCGPGAMVDLAVDLGLDALGVDGDHTLDRAYPDRFLLHDYTAGPAPIARTFDLAWSVEFVEHVYEEFMLNYLKSFLQCRFVIITYAPPGWPGHHHVNCQPERYWIERFADYGLRHDPKLTRTLRRRSTMNRSLLNYIRGKNVIANKEFVRNRGLFFVNEAFDGQ